ncbi:trehalose-6-phosphate synthase [Sphingobacterium sp. E70]|nr:trehalose-6-phosphate synthase [Sphingobacterium sp. E70]ULT25715.1 trehalose-6-phosphate synthase [Sphingobacterium sp. E70]
MDGTFFFKDHASRSENWLFHHTAFPAADIFNIIPWRKEIIGSLLLCDFVSFHIPRYVENFVDVIRSHTPFKVVKK